MISHPVHLLSPPEPGSVQSRANSQSGVRDFGALLHAQETDGKTPQGTEGRASHASSPQQLPSGDTLQTLAQQGTAAKPATVLQSTDAGPSGEAVELVSVAWRLRASAGLSYLTTVGAGTVGSADHDGEGAPNAPAQTSTSMGEPPGSSPEADRAPATEELHAVQPTASGPKREAAPADPAPTTDAASPVSAENVAAPVWQERMLRWLPTGEGQGSTAWIRDYRMESSHATRIIDSLRSLAMQQGRQLDRIVLNGHELWRSASKPDV